MTTLNLEIEDFLFAQIKEEAKGRDIAQFVIRQLEKSISVLKKKKSEKAKSFADTEVSPFIRSLQLKGTLPVPADVNSAEDIIVEKYMQ